MALEGDVFSLVYALFSTHLCAKRDPSISDTLATEADIELS